MNFKQIFIIFLIIVGVLTIYLQLPLDPISHDLEDPTKQDTQISFSEDIIRIKNYKYAPDNLIIEKGTTLTWINEDIVRHDVVIDDDSLGGPRSELLTKGEEYSYTFNEVGVFEYHCTPHPFMKAKIEVIERR